MKRNILARLRGGRHHAIVAACLIALITLFAKSDSTQAFCEVREDGSICHVDLVEDLSDLIRPELYAYIDEHILDPDDYGVLNTDYSSADHFDFCNFDGGIAKINDRYLSYSGNEVVRSLSLSQHSSADWCRDYPGASRRINSRQSQELNQDVPSLKWGHIIIQFVPCSQVQICYGTDLKNSCEGRLLERWWNDKYLHCVTTQLCNETLQLGRCSYDKLVISKRGKVVIEAMRNANYRLAA